PCRILPFLSALCAQYFFNVVEGHGAVEPLRGLVGKRLDLEQPGPQVRVVSPEVAQLRQLRVGAEETAVSIRKLIDGRQKAGAFAQLIRSGLVYPILVQQGDLLTVQPYQ